ncbi:MAG TPA: DUF2285 domain-containing protein [Allosphingosinicella sp.]|nr:DUF2285 domain-containing protein [Allosphingosinicella sp.]
MAGFADGLPDWRDAAAYRPLLAADRAAFAWEWLRRDEAYRTAAAATLRAALSGAEEPACWGLHAFVDPALPAVLARPVWRLPDYPYVLEAVADPALSSADAFELEKVRALATVLRSPSGPEHLLLSDGYHNIRLDIIGGSVAAGPVALGYRLCGFRTAQAPLLVLRRLLALMLTGRFQRGLFPPDARAPRRILLLRAHDALNAGARQRDIAEMLLSAEAREPRWRLAAPSLRSRVQRLVRDARAMARGGYRLLLSAEAHR